jgi:glycopeptide antibiotics resistance protein
MFFIALSLIVVGLALAVGAYVPAPYRSAAWALVIAAAVVPWLGFQGHPHWDRVGWIPFGSPPFRARDMLANVALYVPFGFWYRPGSLAIRRDLLPVVAWALALSAATEAAQVFSHGRFPSMTDVVTNVAGAALGVVLVRALTGRS